MLCKAAGFARREVTQLHHPRQNLAPNLGAALREIRDLHFPPSAHVTHGGDEPKAKIAVKLNSLPHL
jgi:hypothetical protein